MTARSDVPFGFCLFCGAPLTMAGQDHCSECGKSLPGASAAIAQPAEATATASTSTPSASSVPPAAPEPPAGATPPAQPWPTASTDPSAPALWGSAPAYPGTYPYPYPGATQTSHRKRALILTAIGVVIAIVLVGGLFFVASSGKSLGATLVSAQIVDHFTTSGDVSIHYDGRDIIQITLDFRFDKKLTADLNPNGSDTFRQAVYKKLAVSPALTCDGTQMDTAYGYWPTEAGADYANGMVMFWVVPQDRTADGLRFTYGGSVLGDGVKGIDMVIHPQVASPTN